VSNGALSKGVTAPVISAINEAAALACADRDSEAKTVISNALNEIGVAMESSDPDPKNILPSHFILIMVYLLIKTSNAFDF